MTKRIVRGLMIKVLVIAATIAHAQQPAKIPRIGVLITATPSVAQRRLQAFQQGLRGLGYIEGKDIILDYRYAEGKPETLPSRIAELIELKVDVILTDTSNAIQAAKNATKIIPVVFTTANDPVGDGQVASLARPGGNLTGFSILTIDLNGKRIEILKESFPNITRVGFLTASQTSGSEQFIVSERRFKDAEGAVEGLGLRLQLLGAKDADDLERVIEAASRAGVQAFLAHPSTFVGTNRGRIMELAVKFRLPAIYGSTEYSEAGGLMSYGPDLLDNYRRAAGYVDKILKGTKPAELPVQQPMKFDFVINLKTAKQMGFRIPPDVLARANKVVR
jgi:putative ABC transport system substrate-binding protein